MRTEVHGRPSPGNPTAAASSIRKTIAHSRGSRYGGLGISAEPSANQNSNLSSRKGFRNVVGIVPAFSLHGVSYAQPQYPCARTASRGGASRPTHCLIVESHFVIFIFPPIIQGALYEAFGHKQ
jgi:hypothetical protein